MKARIIAGVTAAAVASTTIAVSAITGDEKYPYDYSIENLLSDYQLFVAGDLSSPPHTVGAVAVGGTATLGSWGDGQIVPSYVHNMGEYGNNAGGSWIPEVYRDGVVYYGGAAEELVGKLESSDNFIENDSYIDFAEAMDAVSAESALWAENVYNVSEKDIVKVQEGAWGVTYVKVDLSQHKDIAVPYSILSQVDRVDLEGVDSVNDLATGGYSVSFTGVNDNSIKFTSGFSSPGDSEINLSLNGGSDPNAGLLSNAFKEIDGTEQGGQLNLAGMNFVLNFPDARNVEYQYATGHVVAPKADVTLSGGNSEGGVIAGGSITTEGEAHFFPYNVPSVRNVKKAVDTVENGSSSTTTTTSETTTTTSETTTTTPESTTTTTSETTTTSAATTSKETTTTTTSVSSETPKPSSTSETGIAPETTTTTSKATTTTTPKATTTTSESTTTTTSKETTTTSKATTTTSAATTSKETTTTPASSDKPEPSSTSKTGIAPEITTTTSKATTTTSKSTTTSESTTTTTSKATTTTPKITTTSEAEETTTTTASESEETTTTSASSPDETTAASVSSSDETTTTSASSSDETTTTTTSGSDKTTTTTTTKKSTDGNNDKTTTTTSKKAVGSANNSKTVNTASSSSPNTGSEGFATLSVAALLTGAAALYIGKKRFDKEDR